MTKIKNIKKITILIFLCLLIFGQTVSAQDDSHDTYNKAANVARYAGFNIGGKYVELSLLNMIGLIVKYLLSFLGVIFMILIIYAGFLWMTARGNENQIEKSKSILKSSLIGLLIVVSAYAIFTVISSLLNQMDFFK